MAHRRPLSISTQLNRNNNVSANNIHVQRHKTNIINEEWTKNDARFVAFYDMRAVTFVLPDEMADQSIKPHRVSRAN